MRISDWSSDVCSSDLSAGCRRPASPDPRVYTWAAMRVKITRGAAVLACRGREWRRAMAAERSVPSARFTVDPLPPRRRYETWRERIACGLEVEGPRTPLPDAAFHATGEAQPLRPL